MTHPHSAPNRTGHAGHVDVMIVGAGISGIASAYHLSTQCPGKSFVVLEAKESFGGTWHTHRYPGIRSDSDLHTFGYRFKPWQHAPIASGAEILAYLGEVIEENGLAPHIRYGHAIRRAAWRSDANRWEVEAVSNDTGETVTFTAGFLWMCQGYYHHDTGFTPEWHGMSSFKGRIVHPQHWPDDLDLAGRKVLVIGSGATAATLVPSVADDCEHVTMLQRSPTYFMTGRNANPLAEELRDLDIPEAWTHEIVRRKILQIQQGAMRRAQAQPEEVRAELIAGVREHLGPDFDVNAHFTPRYRPWQQRVAFVPDGDLFRKVREGKASIVTDEIETFRAHGVLLKSGAEIEADVVVTATGFNLNVFGDMAITVDGQPVNFADTVTYRGMMFTGVPNFTWVFGYFRASWTLRAELIADFVCRLLAHMEKKGVQRVTAALRPDEQDMPLAPWCDADSFNPGYLMRGIHLLPRRGNKKEWQHSQDYWSEKEEFPVIDLDDGVFRYA